MIRIISHLSWISATLQDPARHSWGNSEAQNPNSMIRRPVLTRKCYFFIAVPMDSCDSKSHSYSVCLSLSIIYSMFYPIIPSLSHHYPIIIPSFSPIISHIFSRKIPKFWHLQGTAVKSSMAHWSQTGRAACNWHLAIQDIRCYMTWMRYITCIIHVYYIHIIYI